MCSGSCLPRQDNTQHSARIQLSLSVREVLLHCGCCMYANRRVAKKNRGRPRFFILFSRSSCSSLLIFVFYIFFCVALCQQCNQVDDALSEKKRSRVLLLPLRLLLVCKSRLEECNAGRQRDRETGRQTGSVVHDGAGLKGLRRSVRNPRNYPFIGLGATVAAVAVAVAVAVAGVRVGR